MTVSENPSVIRLEGDELRWWRAGATNSAMLDDLTVLPKNTVFAAPSDAVRLKTFEVDAAEIKHLSRSLPFLLEDDVVDDIDALHFARQPLSDQRWLAGIVARDEVARWQSAMGEAFEGPWVPECLLLPWQQGEVCVLVEDTTALIRVDEWQGARIEHALLAALIAALPEAPGAIVLYGQDQAADMALIPEHLRAVCQWRQGGFGSALMISRAEAPMFNLRQGEFAPRLPLQRWWGHWRRVAIAAGVAVTLSLGANVAEYQRLKAENVALRAAVQDSYRQANPKGAVVDAEKQLDRQIAEFNPSSTGVSFTPLLASITGAVAEDAGISISTLNFSASGKEVRLDLMASDYAAVESLRRRLDGAGLKATLETSSSRDDQVRARLRVEAGV